MFLTVLTYIAIGLLAILAIFYLGLEVRFYRALGRVREGFADPEPLPKVSILIAARNESEGIRETLNSVLSQDYEGEWEVWVADDRSTDDTPKILAEYEAKFERLHVLTIDSIPEGVSPKKQAISKMIEACNGEILCLTDADCIVQPSWIKYIVKEFEPGIELVAGHSYIPTDKSSPFIICMQAVETLIYRIAGTAGLAMHLPLTSTGNNLAYRMDGRPPDAKTGSRPSMGHALLHHARHVRHHKRQGNAQGPLGTAQTLGIKDHLLYPKNRLCALDGVPVPHDALHHRSVLDFQFQNFRRHIDSVLVQERRRHGSHYSRAQNIQAGAPPQVVHPG